MSDENYSFIIKNSQKIADDLNSNKVLHHKFNKLQNEMIKEGYGFGVEYAESQDDQRVDMRQGGIKIINGFCPNKLYFDQFISWDHTRKLKYDDDINDLILTHPDCSSKTKQEKNSKLCRTLNETVRKGIINSWVESAVFGYVQTYRKNKGIDNIKINENELKNLEKIIKKEQQHVYLKLKNKKEINPEFIFDKVKGVIVI